jgi:hypothetical protein
MKPASHRAFSAPVVNPGGAGTVQARVSVAQSTSSWRATGSPRAPSAGPSRSSSSAPRASSWRSSRT